MHGFTQISARRSLRQTFIQTPNFKSAAHMLNRGDHP